MILIKSVELEDVDGDYYEIMTCDEPYATNRSGGDVVPMPKFKAEIVRGRRFSRIGKGGSRYEMVIGAGIDAQRALDLPIDAIDRLRRDVSDAMAANSGLMAKNTALKNELDRIKNALYFAVSRLSPIDRLSIALND